MREVAERIASNVPAADAAEIKRGKWVQLYDNVWHCTNCEKTSVFGENIESTADYCENCGAKMRPDAKDATREEKHDHDADYSDCLIDSSADVDVLDKRPQEMTAEEARRLWEEMKLALADLVPKMNEAFRKLAMDVRRASAEVSMAIREAQNGIATEPFPHEVTVFVPDFERVTQEDIVKAVNREIERSVHAHEPKPVDCPWE